jgi:GntR family transcriptional regulator/MocR family aminotransferase
MVLPEALMAEFQARLGFYGCTVPSFEQYTLARFLQGGCFEKHINRMRKFYKSRRNRVLGAIEGCAFYEKLTILEENAGLHFLVKVETDLSDAALSEKCRKLGLLVRPLSSYYHDAEQKDTHCLVVNYSGLSDGDLEKLENILKTS